VTHIRHVTLTTGHARDSFQGEVAPEALGALADLLSQALAGGRAPIPNTGCALTATAEGHALLATVYGAEASGVAPPIVTIGVARKSRVSPRLWGLLHEDRLQLATDPDTWPPAPWCAARLDVGAATYPEAMGWVGDFERCLAWAWVVRQ